VRGACAAATQPTQIFRRFIANRSRTIAMGRRNIAFGDWRAQRKTQYYRINNAVKFPLGGITKAIEETTCALLCTREPREFSA
jgi:hypothetical protein